MPNRFSPAELTAIPNALSVLRMGTYLNAVGGDAAKALRLYHWNAQVSAGFLFPLHILEVSVRNGAAGAIETAYANPNWPWDTGFETSLPSPPGPVFSPRGELRGTRGRHLTTGKVIAEMKFAFWEHLFTKKHDGRLWIPSLAREFPGIAAGTPVPAARLRIAQVLGSVRKLRNRIAHHEPVFARDLVSDYADILEVISYRSPEVAAWVARSQTVYNLLTLRP